jgi:hypothetical protein
MASNSKVAEEKEQVVLKEEQLRGSQPSSSCGRDESSKTVKVSWVEMAMQDVQKWETSWSKGSSKKDPSHTAGIAFVSEGAVVVADPVWEAEPLLVWETKLLPGDGKEQEALKVEESTSPSNTGVQPSKHEEESVDLVDPPSDED